MNNEAETKIMNDMMNLIAIDPEIGYHRCRFYPDVLINPWSGTIKVIKSGKVFDHKFRTKMVKWLVWHQFTTPTSLCSQVCICSPKTETKPTTPFPI